MHTDAHTKFTYLFLMFNCKLVGILVFGVGIYAWIEKDTFTRLSNLSIGVLFDPAFIFLVVGAFVFVIGFCGCVGALRENTNLLLVVSLWLHLSLLKIDHKYCFTKRLEKKKLF